MKKQTTLSEIIADTKEDISLKSDIVFKAFFSEKGNEKFLIDF